MFDYEGGDQPIESFKSRHETDFFNTMIDSVISNMDLRFMSLYQHFENFGILSDLNKFKNIPKEQILKNCQDLHIVLQVGENRDFQPYELYEKLQNMIPYLPNTITDVKPRLQYVIENDLKEIFQNIYIVFRILSIIPVSTTSAKRSFTKSKLIKNYVRNTMGQERLSALAVFSIETDVASKINYEPIIKNSSKTKSRKFLFL
ncbi:dimer_Tnp_hAT domain-containing protein [Trichonephila clavipes]|nr:dimer_Tnp_hAT domain-containing protein [Trichonephila clavipes]